jgi:hypothetical protein
MLMIQEQVNTPLCVGQFDSVTAHQAAGGGLDVILAKEAQVFDG